MKTAFLIICGLLLSMSVSLSATNDVASALQKGLFEEEANQNLTAAIQAYKIVANQFDKDRKLAATAIFRLGECYRKQGSTNEAAAQYDRVLRDFSDQAQLVALSRRQLHALGAAPVSTIAEGAGSGTGSTARTELLTLESQLADMKKMTKEQLRITVQQNFPNPVLTSLMQRLSEAEQTLAAAEKEYGPQHAEVLKSVELIKTVNKQLDAQTEAVLRSLEIKHEALKKASEILPADPGNRDVARNDAALDLQTTALTSSEAEEVKRIQMMIKDSPDLINARDPAIGGTPLHRAAGQGQLIVARFLIANGADVDATAAGGDSPLHRAARAGNKAMAELLLNSKANVRSLNDAKMTPLHLAAASGFRSVAELLLSRGADANAKAQYGTTPLHLAAANGFRSVAELLVAHGADVNPGTSEVRSTGQQRFTGTPLVIAATRGDLPLVELLLTNKADLLATDEKGCAPLCLAAVAGNIPEATTLLSHGAEVDIKATGKELLGWTPLHAAVNANQREMVEFLLRNKADPNARIGTRYGEGGEGYTPLLMATARVLPDIVDALLAGNADPNLGNSSRLPILNALNNENPIARKQIAKSLVEHGAQVNVRDGNGNTPLLLAAARGDADTATALVAGRADVTAIDKNGRSPLHLAISAGQGPNITELVKVLLAAHANPNLRDGAGDTPLHFAAGQNKQELVELLLASNADPNLQNNRGETPLDYAKRISPSNPFGAINLYGNAGGGTIPIQSTGSTIAIDTTPSGSTPPPAAPPSMADLLRQHGALDDLPHTNQIVASRSADKFSTQIFWRMPEDWNEFTLFELLAVQYGFLSTSPTAQAENSLLPGFVAPQNALAFPDFSRIHIRRLAPDRKSWQDRTIDLTAALQSGDCSANVPLQWGDVVEIPEAEHVLGESWSGLASETISTLKKCLVRQVQVTIKGQTTNLTVAVKPMNSVGGGPSPGARFLRPSTSSTPTFMLAPVLHDSRLLLASSDLSRIKITRLNPETGKTKEWVVNCNDASKPPSFWLRDGDKIEVPEKASLSGLPATSPSSAAPSFSRPSRESAPAAYSVPAAGQAPLAYQWRSGDPNLASVAAPGSAPFASVPAAVQVEDETPVPVTPAVRSIPTRPLRMTPPSVTPASLAGSTTLYSPRSDDPRLLASGYQPEQSSKPRVGQWWDERAKADLPGRSGNTIVWTGKEMIVFGGEGMGVSYDDGARFNFAGDSWELLPRENAPSSRTGSTAVWTGKEMIVWGGFGGRLGTDTNRNDGARFDPVENAWIPVSTQRAPEARFDHTALWTGKEMLIWGGYTDSHSRYAGAHVDGQLNSGGRYNPMKDSWKPITRRGAPSKRLNNAAVWTGREMLIWGGLNSREALGDGARYDPDRDSWKPISSKGAPGPRLGPATAWTGKEMIVWGGISRDNDSKYICFEDGARYNPQTDSWSPISRAGAPKGRAMTSAVWTGTEMLLWGGVNDTEAKGVSDSSRYVGTGALYNPATDTWTNISEAGAPSPRVTTGVWNGNGLLLFGGYNGLHLNDTWFYSPKQTLYPYAKK